MEQRQQVLITGLQEHYVGNHNISRNVRRADRDRVVLGSQCRRGCTRCSSKDHCSSCVSKKYTSRTECYRAAQTQSNGRKHADIALALRTAVDSCRNKNFGTQIDRSQLLWKLHESHSSVLLNRVCRRADRTACRMSSRDIDSKVQCDRQRCSQQLSSFAIGVKI